MAQTIRKLNETRYHLDSILQACRQKILALETTKEELIRQNIILQNKYQILLLDQQKPQNIQKTQRILSPERPLDKLFNHTPAGQLNKIHQLSFHLGDTIETVKEKITENLYPNLVSFPNQLFDSQLNFLLEFRPSWSELNNITALRHNFPTISFYYSLAKTIDNEDILYKALSFGTIRTIYIFSQDMFKFFPPTLDRALATITEAPLVINFNSLPLRPQVINKTKTSVILPAYHVIFICEGAKKHKRRFYHDRPNFSARDLYRRTHEIAAFYEWLHTHDRIIAQAEHYTIIAQKHLVHEELLIPLLQIKVDNLQKHEEYLEVLDEINDMPSSGHESEAMSHQSLDEDIAEVVEEMMDP